MRKDSKDSKTRRKKRKSRKTFVKDDTCEVTVRWGVDARNELRRTQYAESPSKLITEMSPGPRGASSTSPAFSPVDS